MATKKTATKKVKKEVALSSGESMIYSAEGKKLTSLALPEKVFGLKWNASLVHQVVTSMMANARTPVAHAKDRGEVRGGGKKPWKQKGTGRARHGSIRSPIWKGGGVTHGPLSWKDYSKKINKKMRTKALAIVLSQKNRDTELLFVDALPFTSPKTKTAKQFLTTFGKMTGFEKMNYKKNAALIVTPERDVNTIKSFKNFGNVTVMDVNTLNAKDALTFKHVVFVSPEQIIQTLSKRCT